MKTTALRKHYGFTLIELTFAITLLAIMFTMAIMAFIGVLKFSVWSKTTRTNQVNARDTMEAMKRIVESKTIVDVTDGGTKLCLKEPGALSGKSTQITNEVYLVPSRTIVVTKEYNNLTCGGTPSTTEPLTRIDAYATNLKFELIYGAYQSQTYMTTHNYKKTVKVDMTVLNGNDSGGGNCATADNFCDKASFNTAIVENTI